MKAVVLAGGLGTRLRPLTETRPKPLVPILNRPILAWVLDRIPAQVTQVIITTSYMADEIQAWVDTQDLGRPTRVLDEGEPKSTGGAIKNLADELDERFLVFNGDILDNLNLDAFIAFHIGNGPPLGSISLKRVRDPEHYGVAVLEGDRVVEFVEKPQGEPPSDLINAGTYLFEPEILDHIPDGKVHLESEVFPKLLDHDDGLLGFALEGYWIDCGRPENLIRANHMLMERDPDAVDGDPPLNPPAVVGTGGDLHSKSTIGPFATLGDNVTVGAGAKLRECIVLDDAQIGRGARLDRVIVGKGAVVGDDVELEAFTVLGDGQIVNTGDQGTRAAAEEKARAEAEAEAEAEAAGKEEE